jgi:fructokinase
MILCCGEALIDMLPRLTAEGEAAFVPHPGGSVFNSAVALGRLGAPAGFFSGLSSDLFGRQLRDRLAESQVDTRHALITDRPTTLAFVTLADGQASYLFYDEETAGRMVSKDDLPLMGDDIDALLFGGISLIPEPCGSAYEELMRREHGRRLVMLDPNIRAAFIQDRDAHLARMRRMIAMADIVKVSGEDLAWFGADDAQAFASACLAGGTRLLLVTAGGRGVSAYVHGGARIHIPANAVKVVDTVGAGDSFNAGLLAALAERGMLSKEAVADLDEKVLGELLEFAVRAATVTVSRAGANPPWRHEIPPSRSIPA